MKLKFLYRLSLICCVSLLSCSDNNEDQQPVVESVIRNTYNELDSCDNIEFRTIDFDIKEFPILERPYSDTSNLFELPEHKDDHNIQLHFYNNKYDYHPVSMATYALSLIDIYLRTGNEECITLAKKHADKLRGISLPKDSCILFPYSFNYSFFDRDKMIAPWYSAMAQGKCLSLFSRLFEITKEDHYKKTADAIFKSFYRMKATHSDWVSCVDQEKNLWLEEYPYDGGPSHVFNGMVFAIFGLYDYYMINPSQDAEKFLKGAVATIKLKKELIRVKDDISFYCFKYTVKNPYYHPIHIDQLNFLGKFSGALDFGSFSESLRKDGEKHAEYQPEKVDD